ncbi:MAG: MFS transporter [Candidatus Helarchaeota archaeon]|nr:MFS transporter [Candidatus Helarchaeota archaeon]
MENKKGVKVFTGFVLSQMLIIGLLFTAAESFGMIEAEMFNTYLDHVLGLAPIYITIMVALSAMVGLITMIVFGIMSDNTRSTRFGRRRPYLLIGGLGAGVSMIVFAFSGNFLTALIIDVIAVGIASNAFYTAQRAIIPDVVDVNHRGRANSIAVNLSTVGLGIGIALFFIINELFGVPDGNGGTNITQEGYILALSVGGIIFICVGIIGFLWLKEPPVSDMPPKKKFIREFREIFNIKELKKNRDFYKFVIAFTIFNSGNSVFLPFLFIFIFDLGLSTLTLISILAIAAPFLIIVTVLLGRFADNPKFGRKRLLPPTILIGSIGFFLVPLSAMTTEPIIPLYGFVFTLILVMLVAVNTPLNAWHQDLLPERTRGKFLGILNITRTLSQVIGVIVGGIVATLISIEWIFAFAPIFYITSIPFFLTIKETLPDKK